jgi:hypothetical protein
MSIKDDALLWQAEFYLAIKPAFILEAIGINGMIYCLDYSFFQHPIPLIPIATQSFSSSTLFDNSIASIALLGTKATCYQEFVLLTKHA